MRIVARKTLKNFWENHKDSEQHLKFWFDTTKKGDWNNFNELKLQFPDASIVGNDRVVFNIKGNQYRLVVKIDFKWQVLFIKFIGTHKEYDTIDVKNI